MRRFLTRLLRTAAVIAGLLVIFAAISIGAFRLFAASLPSYKEDLQAWVSESLNLTVQYAAIDLRLGLAGPELAFFDAALAREGSDQPFVLARRASVVIDPLALFIDRTLVPVSLVFDGIEITVERSADGRFSVAGAPQAADAINEGGFEIPEEVSVQIRDSAVLYVDETRGIRWPFSDVRADIEQEFRGISISISADPPEDLGERLNVTADGIVSANARFSDDWRTYIAIRGAYLEPVSAIWPQLGVASGFGDLSVWLQSDDGRIVSALADIALEDVVIPFRSGIRAYERVELIGELTRQGDVISAVLSDMNITGPGGEWPRETTTRFSFARDTGVLELNSDYLRLDDIVPLVAAVPDFEFRDDLLALDPRGSLADVELRLGGTQTDDYAVAGHADELGFSQWQGIDTIDGFTGTLRMDAGGGSLDIDAPRLTARVPDVVDRTVELQNLSGIVQWRAGRDATRVLSDALSFDWIGAHVSASGELSLPHDDSSPVLELETQVSAFAAADALPYVLAVPMHPRLREWLAASLGPGTLQRTDIEFYGPLAAFPFDNGEGEFLARAQVSGGVVDYAPGWPRAEAFDGRVEFHNASLYAGGRAQVLGNISEDVDVTIANLRAPVLNIDGNTEGPLGDVLEFLLTAPPIAEYLGPDYARLRAPDGLARVRLDLDIPLPDTTGYRIDAGLEVTDGTLSLQGFGPTATDVSGSIALADGIVSGDGIQAIFLEGPAFADVRTVSTDGYRTQLNLRGEVSADAVVRAFNLPYGAHVAGQTRWDGRLLLPDVVDEGTTVRPTRLEVRSNLSGLALRFPAPFAKPPGDAMNLALNFAFAADGNVEIGGNLGASRHFVGEFGGTGEGLQLSRGLLAFGSQPDMALPGAGLAISGELPDVDLDAWRTLSGSPRFGQAGPLLSNVQLNFADLSLWGQRFGPTSLAVERQEDAMRVDIDATVIAGEVRIPQTLNSRESIEASLQRLYWQTGDDDGAEVTIDPRRWPGLVIDVEDFRLGPRNIGSVQARVDPDPLGLRLVSFTAVSESLNAEGSGAWLVDDERTMSRVAVSASSADVEAALADLGLDPLLSGNEAQLTATLQWPGGPGANWMDHLSGDLALRIADGSMLDIEPGAGRLVGLMSIVALPRRLALDFRDVFNRGFVFDEISADFMIVDGNAFTDNLKLAGPAAEIGVAGRTGLRDRNFRQQAVVTAEPGNMLPTVGGLIAGPGVGAALLIFTRIFKEPLKGIGRASYCITGGWDDPVVERLSAEQLESEEICADLPPGWVTTNDAEGAP